MRLIAWLIVLAACCPVLADEKSVGELEKLQTDAVEARKAAAADPTIKNVESKPVLAYLIEQKRRRLSSIAGLRQRIEKHQADKSGENLLPVLKEQLAELERKPLEQVSFDSAYGYPPTTGLVGYSKKVRLIENNSDSKSVILVDGTALVIEGLGTSQYPSGKFFNVEKAILIGVQGPDQLFQGTMKKSYAATLVDLEAVLKAELKIPNRPKVPGTLRLYSRYRRESTTDGRVTLNVIDRAMDWQVSETAIVVCDMWDNHHCKIAAQRVGVMAPRMNHVLTAARDRGVMIIHAPSETMNIYAGTLFRTRMERAKPAQPPVPIERRCVRDPNREPATLPVDTQLDCDDAELGPVVRFHTRQHAGLDIIGFDGISDSGQEIYNFCQQEGIKNLVLMGVHTNYCIVNRSFGIRQMARVGMNVVLARDLTDALYDPREPPFVSHARGTEIVVEHIERYLSPSILSADLTHVVPGSDGPVTEKPKVSPASESNASTTSDPDSPLRRIFVAGGGVMGSNPPYPLLRYIVSLSGKPDPVVVCLPTARGDNLENLAQWYETMNQLPCRPRHLRLFGPTKDLRDFEQQLLSADVIFVPGGNTLNMLATWKAQGVDAILRKAWERGILLAGESAGMVCWFEEAVTDSKPGQLTRMECLGWLKGSVCAHYHFLPQPRRPRLHEMLISGEMKDGVACDDGAGILFEGDKLAKVVSVSEAATAYMVRRNGDQVVEEPLKAELLVNAK
ncbi:MAG: isochorismatase family protein [Planctomycetaceae bacterium]|nr:isochorismatase family protein [Planctomycetaceae bacterium]